MANRTRFEAGIDKRDAVKEAEAAGKVADNMDVRKGLMARVHSGEMTLKDAQAELERIKRAAKKDGKLTRSQAFSQG